VKFRSQSCFQPARVNLYLKRKWEAQKAISSWFRPWQCYLFQFDRPVKNVDTTQWRDPPDFIKSVNCSLICWQGRQQAFYWRCRKSANQEPPVSGSNYSWVLSLQFALPVWFIDVPRDAGNSSTINYCDKSQSNFTLHNSPYSLNKSSTPT